jgi:hypothetical protein
MMPTVAAAPTARLLPVTGDLALLFARGFVAWAGDAGAAEAAAAAVLAAAGFLARDLAAVFGFVALDAAVSLAAGLAARAVLVAAPELAGRPARFVLRGVVEVGVSLAIGLSVVLALQQPGGGTVPKRRVFRLPVNPEGISAPAGRCGALDFLRYGPLLCDQSTSNEGRMFKLPEEAIVMADAALLARRAIPAGTSPPGRSAGGGTLLSQ